MQQPPQGRQPGPYRPPQGAPPGNRPGPPPPPGGRPGPASVPTQYGQPAAPPPSIPPPYSPPPAALAAPRRRKRGALRFVAASCVVSAWVTLVLSLLFAVGSFLAGATAAATAARATAASNSYSAPSLPTTPGLPGSAGIPELGSDEMGGLGGGQLGGGGPLGGIGPAAGLGAMTGLLQAFIPGICFASGAFTLVSGIVGFILFLGVAQACYALLDLEDQSFQMSQTLNTIVARLGSGQPVR